MKTLNVNGKVVYEKQRFRMSIADVSKINMQILSTAGSLFYLCLLIFVFYQVADGFVLMK